MQDAPKSICVFTSSVICVLSGLSVGSIRSQMLELERGIRGSLCPWSPWSSVDKDLQTDSRCERRQVQMMGGREGELNNGFGGLAKFFKGETFSPVSRIICECDILGVHWVGLRLGLGCEGRAFQAEGTVCAKAGNCEKA